MFLKKINIGMKKKKGDGGSVDDDINGDCLQEATSLFFLFLQL